MGRSIEVSISKKNAIVREILKGKNVSEFVCQAVIEKAKSSMNTDLPDIANYHRRRFNGKSLYESYMSGDLSGEQLLDINLTFKTLMSEFSGPELRRLTADVSSLYLRRR